jgi:hypothetical protein
MLPRSSSISSSDRLGRARLRRKVAFVIAATIAVLAAFDLAVGIIARPPADPSVEPNGIVRYFGYGESIEGKLRRQLGPTPDKDAPILKAGWIDTECTSAPTSAGARGVTVYGMSFSQRVAAQLATLAPELHVTSFGGPGAPPNHSYACFRIRQERNLDHNGTQVLGILAGSLRRTAATSGLGTSFEAPQPFTFPRYVLRDNQLRAIEPPVSNQAGLRGTLRSHQTWREYVTQLAAQDPFVSPALANHDLLDYSMTARMLRRAWGQRHIADITARLRGGGDYDGDPTLMPALRAMVLDFAQRARAMGSNPVILLFEDRGYDGVLRRTLLPLLEANGIPYVLSADIAPATDAGIFEPDGHFLPRIDRAMAERLRPIVESRDTHAPDQVAH